MLKKQLNTRNLLILLSLTALVCLLFGIMMPMLTVKKIIVVKNTFSIWHGVVTLLHGKTFVLGLILFLFSILFPLVKLTLLIAYGWLYPLPTERLIYFQHLLSKIAKFSMLDVFVVALMLMIVQLGWLLEVVIHSGIYWFSAAVILTLLAEMLLGHDLKSRLSDVH